MADVLSAGEFRNGVTIELEGNIYTIIEFQHVKPGKGAHLFVLNLKTLSMAALLSVHSDLLKK